MSSQADPLRTGIHVVRETMVSVEDGGHQAHSRTASSTTTIRSGEPESLPQQDSRQRQLHMSGAPKLYNDDLLGQDSDEQIQTWRSSPSERETLRDLIDFLRNTSPPPGTSSSSDRKRQKDNKRRLFWPFRKKSKSGADGAKGASGLIKLPDSAVAGRTIGGHRHIAISIPIEYAHLEPTSGSPVSTPDEPWRLPLSILQPVEETRESLDSQTQGKRPHAALGSNDLFSLFSRQDDSPGQNVEAETEQRGLGRTSSPTADTSVGAHNTATLPPELTALQENSISPIVSVTNGPHHQVHRVHSQGSLRQDASRSTGQSKAPVRRSLDPESLRNGQSPASSFYSASSAPTPTDVVTVQIPSPRLAAELSGYLRAVDADGELVNGLSGVDESPRSTFGPGTAGKSEYSEGRPLQLTFSLLEDRLLDPIWETRESSDPSCTPDHSQTQSHPTASLNSHESLPSAQEASFRITPVMTVADVRPSPAESPRSLRRRATLGLFPTGYMMHSDIVIPSSFPSRTPPPSRSEQSQSQSQPQSQPQRHRQPRPLSSITNFKTLKRLLEATQQSPNEAEGGQGQAEADRCLRPNTSTTTTTTTTTAERYAQEQQQGDGQSQRGRPTSVTRSESHQDLIRRYDDLRQTRERELSVLIERLDRLESSNDRWLNVLVPVLERALVMGAPKSRYTGVQYTNGTHREGDEEEGLVEGDEDSFDWDRVRVPGSPQEEQGKGKGKAPGARPPGVLRRNSMGWGTLEPLMRELVEGAGGKEDASEAEGRALVEDALALLDGRSRGGVATRTDL